MQRSRSKICGLASCGCWVPPRRELRLKAGYEIFTVTINPAEERAKPTAEKKDKPTSEWNGWNKLVLGAPATVHTLPSRKRRCSDANKIPTETLEPSLDPLDDVNDMEAIESASLKDDVVDLSARLAHVEGSIMSVIDSKMQVVQQALEASVEALMMRVTQQLEAKLSENGAENRRPCSQSDDVPLTSAEAAWRRSKVSCILVFFSHCPFPCARCCDALQLSLGDLWCEEVCVVGGKK